ncbi:uncharacterized protein GLRG_03089 [Colletotrichum graminicola M1.001]|uniref:Uncharacterized protein n=1 Tax=Colletotrichum graminicola (strain M1.001 / M2 / FGSC 10212) TaxID=645133 RepID=E3QAQ7_COLGM|nr:uncharacterized protein GLRG_03089 [Colletotrichum graminicola M1.001]EFQ27945.1 hypothetical protein GLRG_03089 [Colletotrichum graminicola M1.001]
MRTVATAGSSKSKVLSEQPSKEKRRAASQSGKARHSSKSRSGDSNSSKGEATSKDGFPARPSSPKSRNASRTRMLDRTDSALAYREQASAITQQLGSISQRAESVNKHRGQPEEAVTPHPDRPSSPKSRNCSRSRPSEHLSSILIAASPSIYSDEYNRRSLPALPDTQKTQPQRPMSRMNHHARSGSITETEKDNMRNIRSPSRASISGEQVGSRPASRAASRGRQPGSKFSPPKMSPRDPSSPPVQDADEIIRIERDRRSSIASKPPTGSPGSGTPFERVEAILCPTCPVHGRHSTASDPGATLTSSGHRISPDLSHGRSFSSPAAAKGTENATAATNSKGEDGLNYSITGSNKPSDADSLAETIGTVSSAGRSPSTPPFEPKTPRAMVVICDAENNDIGGTPDLPGSLADLACLDNNIGLSSDGPNAIVA